MTKIDLIKKIEEKRNSKVITYITSDRPGPINAKIAGDIIPIISHQLRKIEKVENIDLFLFSSSNLLIDKSRYCFSVSIPIKFLP